VAQYCWIPVPNSPALSTATHGPLPASPIVKHLIFVVQPTQRAAKYYSHPFLQLTCRLFRFSGRCALCWECRKCRMGKAFVSRTGHWSIPLPGRGYAKCLADSCIICRAVYAKCPPKAQAPNQGRLKLWSWWGAKDIVEQGSRDWLARLSAEKRNRRLIE